MEGNLNATMKIFIGARMIAHASNHHLLPAECYGSLQGVWLQVSLTHTLMADITRQSWATLAVALVDFHTCYDSIAHLPSSITCQHLGAPHLVLETIFSTIQNMKIFLHMAHRDLSSYYGGTPTEGLPFQGMCQGTSAGPALWLASSIPLIKMLHQHGVTSSFQCPVSSQSILLVRLLYVDDCNLFVFIPSATQACRPILDLQANIHLWQGGV